MLLLVAVAGWLLVIGCPNVKNADIAKVVLLREETYGLEADWRLLSG